jgi:hypothetical protein
LLASLTNYLLIWRNCFTLSEERRCLAVRAGVDQGCQMVYLQPKHTNLGNFFRLENVDIFVSHFGYFMTIWYVLYSIVTFIPLLVSCTKTNLATLMWTRGNDLDDDNATLVKCSYR